MTYRTILTHLADEAGAEARLAFAKALAERFGGTLVAVHVTLPPFVPVTLGEGAAFVGPEFYEAQQAAAARVTERMKDVFRAVCEPLTVPALWRHEEGDPGTVVAQLSRSADLTVVAQDTAGGPDILGPSILEQVVLGAGGPVLMVPQGFGGSTCGAGVLVGWNGAREAARAVKDALPFLLDAETVAVAAWGTPPGVRDVLALLDRHGVAAEAVEGEEPADVGKALLAEVARRNADLLVMGAYGHSRLRELVLGGATRWVLSKARLPVLLSC